MYVLLGLPVVYLSISLLIYKKTSTFKSGQNDNYFLTENFQRLFVCMCVFFVVVVVFFLLCFANLVKRKK